MSNPEEVFDAEATRVQLYKDFEAIARLIEAEKCIRMATGKDPSLALSEVREFKNIFYYDFADALKRFLPSANISYLRVDKDVSISVEDFELIKCISTSLGIIEAEASSSKVEASSSKAVPVLTASSKAKVLTASSSKAKVLTASSSKASSSSSKASATAEAAAAEAEQSEGGFLDSVCSWIKDGILVFGKEITAVCDICLKVGAVFLIIKLAKRL